jgi:hypothetical protein
LHTEIAPIVHVHSVKATDIGDDNQKSTVSLDVGRPKSQGGHEAIRPVNPIGDLELFRKPSWKD